MADRSLSLHALCSTEPGSEQNWGEGLPGVLSILPVPLLTLTPKVTRNESGFRILFFVKLHMLESERVELHILESVCVKLHVRIKCSAMYVRIYVELHMLESMCVQLCVIECTVCGTTYIRCCRILF